MKVRSTNHKSPADLSDDGDISTVVYCATKNKSAKPFYDTEPFE